MMTIHPLSPEDAPALAAMRQAFAAGRDLSLPDNVLIAAAACELHPRAVLAGVETRTVRDALPTAESLGIARLPAIQAGDELFEGPDAPERAA